MLKLSIFLENSRATHELTEERITIGRASDNMLQIDDPSVSGRHAQLLLIDERYQPHAYNVGYNDGEPAGQTIMHFHVHVIPRYQGDAPDPRGGIRWVLPDKAAYWLSTEQ